MCGFLLRIIINALLLFLVIAELPGIFVDTLGGMLLGVLIVGLVNATVRPIMMLASRPLNWLHLGGATFIMNIVTPFIVIKTLPGFQIYNMTAPILGVFLMTICSCTLSKVIQDR
ncbi:phage holin family protein [Pelosinus sp. sgz500959]|uniref:phage holin family protein n=1 Tax=Pelosinus sp. sgz500959 TaxID=3242472 RepID=UPI003672396B